MHADPMTSSFRLSEQRMLVTGASGFLGSHLCRRLGDNGAEVHAVSRSLRTTQTGYLRWWQGDMADIATVRNLLCTVKPDVIFHLSGLSTAIPDLKLVLPTLHSLLISTVNTLTVATEIGCRRVVLAASLTEPDPSHADAVPSSPYAAAKWASSVYASMFHKLYALPVAIVRPFLTYGPRQDARKLIPYVILSLLQGEPPKLSSGQQLFDWIYVDDVIEGLLAAAQVPSPEGCPIDLGSGILIPIRAIVEKLVKRVNAEIEPLFGSLADRPSEQVRVANVAHAHAKLGWKPKTSLEDGLDQTVEWYQRQVKDGRQTL